MQLVVKSLIGEESVRTRIANQFNEEVSEEIMEEVKDNGQNNWQGKIVIIHGQCDRYYIIGPSKYKRLFERRRKQ